jgi:hypothetical protein
MLVFAFAALLPLADPPVKLLVLEMEALSGDPSVARSVDPVLLGAVQIDGIEVVSQAEIKKMVALEAARSDVGCDTSSCLAELAGALGAQLVLFGSVSQLGKTTTVALSLFDSRSSQIVRDTLTVNDVGRLPDELPPRARALVEKGGVKIVARPKQEPRPIEPMDLSPLYYAGLGGVIVGGAALIGGGLVATLNEVAIQDPNVSGETKRAAQEAGKFGLILAGTGVVLVGVGAVLLVVVE